MAMPGEIGPSPSPSLPDDASQPNEDSEPREVEKSPEIIRLERVGDIFTNILRDPKVASRYMDWFRKQCRSYKLPSEVPPGVLQCQAACLQLGLPGIYIEVPSDYYSYDVAYRRFILRSPSDDHLCKSVVFINKNWRPEPGQDELDPKNSKYYLVIVQYTGACNTGKLIDFVRALDGNVRSKKAYNFRLAPSEEALELTGFAHNEVAPVGTNKKVPVIMASAITKLVPPMFYVGAGHRDWKLAFAVDEFLDETGCMVADLS